MGRVLLQRSSRRRRRSSPALRLINLPQDPRQPRDVGEYEHSNRRVEIFVGEHIGTLKPGGCDVDANLRAGYAALPQPLQDTGSALFKELYSDRLLRLCLGRPVPKVRVARKVVVDLAQGPW